MIGSVTFNLPSGGIARFRLDSIANMHTDGSGNLLFNVIVSSMEYDFTFACVDEGAAQRVLNYITSLQDASATGSFDIGGGVNYATATITRPFIIYEPLNNAWYLYATGTAMQTAASLSFGGSAVALDLANSSTTNIQSVRLPGQPDFATYTIQLLDSNGGVIVASSAMVFSVALITCNPAPTGGSITCTVSGSSSLVGGTGNGITLGQFPAIPNEYAFSTVAVAAGSLTFTDDTDPGVPRLIWYTSSAAIVSNYIKM